MLNFKKIIIQLLPLGPQWEEIDGIDSLINLIANELERTYKTAFSIASSTPKTNKEWNAVLHAGIYNKGIYNNKYETTVTNTKQFFLNIIQALKRDRISIEIKEKEIHFFGVLEKTNRYDKRRREIIKRDEEFIKIIEELKLAHIKTKYLFKKDLE